MFRRFILNFIREERGQDLVEYSLLLTFVLFCSAGIVYNLAPRMGGTWDHACSMISVANAAAR